MANLDEYEARLKAIKMNLNIGDGGERPSNNNYSGSRRRRGENRQPRENENNDNFLREHIEENF